MSPMATASTSSASSKIFISYKRNVDPDHTLAARVFEGLHQQGHTVFIDSTITVGKEWAKEIEAKVRGSDFLIVFLTDASSRSEMVKGEVEIARDQAAKSGKGPMILPVRLAFAGALPYPLNAWLDPLQYAMWRGEADTGRLNQELAAAVSGTPLYLSPMPPAPVSQRDGAPLYSAPLPPPGGALDTDDPRYIRRQSDDSAFRLISQQGVTLVIKGSRQMGKTSLLVRTLSAAIDQGKRCALVDFQTMGQESLRDSSTFFRRFGRALAEGLEVKQDIAQSWDANLADSQNLTRYMEKQVLQADDGPTVLAIDEADILFQAKFLYDFFGMLRSWHNARANALKKKT